MTTQQEEWERMRERVGSALRLNFGAGNVEWDSDEEWFTVYDEESEHKFAVSVGPI